MRTWVAALLAAGIVAAAAGASAHHSIAGIYREDQGVTIEGELVALIYRNPHSYLHVQAPDRDNRTRLWAVESRAGQRLRETLASAGLLPGDRIIVTGAPGRDDGQWRMRLRTIVRPRDGWQWTEGPRINQPATRGVGRGGPTSAEPRPGEGPRSKQ